MEGAMPNTPLDREEDKKEIFARVWKRVMGDHTDACPITWEETGETRPRPQPSSSRPWSPRRRPRRRRRRCSRPPCSPRRPAAPQRLSPGRCPGVLGPQCLDCAPLLQELIRRELADCREYQTLSRRAGGGPARVLAGLAGEKKRRAKRLSAAYFLISGVRYWPEGEKCPPVTSYLGTLRRRFAQEQATMAAYLTGTETTTDPCLQQLFWEHAREAWDQACKIRTLVEQA
ncbi:MAG: rubrerythrin [Evtepia gabavorous]